jgi:hypothetical protein
VERAVVAVVSGEDLAKKEVWEVEVVVMVVVAKIRNHTEEQQEHLLHHDMKRRSLSELSQSPYMLVHFIRVIYY